MMTHSQSRVLQGVNILQISRGGLLPRKVCLLQWSIQLHKESNQYTESEDGQDGRAQLSLGATVRKATTDSASAVTRNLTNTSKKCTMYRLKVGGHCWFPFWNESK